MTYPKFLRTALFATIGAVLMVLAACGDASNETEDTETSTTRGDTDFKMNCDASADLLCLRQRII